MTSERLAPLVLAALLAPGPAGAHGVAVEIARRDGAVAARARYDGGAPLSGARYEVVSPAHPQRAFDAGRTDRHGWMVFVPDAPGTWRVRIVDDSGHGRVAEVEVGPAVRPVPSSASPLPRDAAPPLPDPLPRSASLRGGEGDRRAFPTATSGSGAGSGAGATAVGPAPSSPPPLPPRERGERSGEGGEAALRVTPTRTFLGAAGLLIAFAVLHAVQRRRRGRA